MREWWRKQPLEHRRALIAGRDPDKVREQGRKKMARLRAQGTPEQQQKIAARTMLGKAVRRGDIERKPCEVCGDPNSQGHHEDYNKPLDVQWLCQEHHLELHRERGDLADAA